MSDEEVTYIRKELVVVLETAGVVLTLNGRPHPGNVWVIGNDMFEWVRFENKHVRFVERFA